eukprot:CAMPEP_0206306442 /NCGR_PEP_ID=MMETSP0106_2-20121207/10801_1 /ASSEMBLY_ACC=CAM_ASM_000206 /TAXON_ID=81532 /ORGANISM="Acanthoeca-like sp., Strain 10tr" /LENGTH=594 /DNA_ID=CAMNT_0053737361 /DNA_START=100 /DNA_END=1884 /DNA_ORIENTATION=+
MPRTKGNLVQESILPPLITTDGPTTDAGSIEVVAAMGGGIEAPAVAPAPAPAPAPAVATPADSGQPSDPISSALASHQSTLDANPHLYFVESEEATAQATEPEVAVADKQYEAAFAHTTENSPDLVQTIASAEKQPPLMPLVLGSPVGTPTPAPAARATEAFEMIVSQTGSSRITEAVGSVAVCISAAVCELSRDKVKTIDNRTAEYDGRIDEIEKNGARMVAFEDADDFEKAMQLEEQDNADAVEINDDILADIDDIAENAEHDSTNLSGGLRDTLAPARTAVAEASERLDGESASFQADLDRLYQNRTSIEVEITQQTDAMSVEEADFAKFENTADSRRSEIMKGITGLEACLAADLKVRADTTERTNNHNRSLKVHACKMTTLEQLHRICNDQIARHEEALAVIAANLRGCALASELLDEVEKWCVAGYEARRDAPADAAEIVASADYRRQLMTRSITLLNTAIIRRYNIVKAAANKVAISKARITRTKQQEAAAFKFRNRAKVVELKRLREGEYSEELVTDEADHAKHLVDFETFVEQTRYAVTRKQLISDFDETDDSIGKDALEVVAEMPTTDEHIINGEGQLALMMLQ